MLNETELSETAVRLHAVVACPRVLRGKTVAVVVPAYNEETQLGAVIESMPAFVDRIVVVNDKSTDRTGQIAREWIVRAQASETIRIDPARLTPTPRNETERRREQAEAQEAAQLVPSRILNASPETDRVIVIEHERNGGVGASIASGYKWCKDHAIDCTAVMAGDGQMDPSDLESLCLPVLEDGIDYVKGNRLIHRDAWEIIPKVRFFGNSVLSILTKLASGYWRVSDTQTGYTAIGLKALRALKLHEIYPSYGMPNDLLVKLNIVQCTLKEVEIKPVYRVGEQSKMRVAEVIPRVSLLLVKSFFVRLWRKYFLRDFHPLFLFYNYAMIAAVCALPYAGKILHGFYVHQTVHNGPLTAFVFFATSGFQSLLFAIWLDIQDNERLYK